MSELFPHLPAPPPDVAQPTDTEVNIMNMYEVVRFLGPSNDNPGVSNALIILSQSMTILAGERANIKSIIPHPVVALRMTREDGSSLPNNARVELNCMPGRVVPFERSHADPTLWRPVAGDIEAGQWLEMEEVLAGTGLVPHLLLQGLMDGEFEAAYVTMPVTTKVTSFMLNGICMPREHGRDGVRWI